MALALSTALFAAPGAVADDLKDGKAALQADRLDDAMRLFEKAAGQGLAEGRAGVGFVQLKRRKYAEALEAFRTAQKMDALVAAGFYGEGEVLRRQGKCDGALPLLRKAVDLDRKYPEAQLAMGYCLIEGHKHEEAVAAFNQGLKWGPKWRPKFLVALGDAELARDSLRDAGIYYTRAREESPEDATPRKALGLFYIKRGTFELAIPEYQSALAIDTSDVELRFGLGQALFYAQRYNEALEVYREVVGRDPEFAPGQLALGDLYYRSGLADRRRFTEARGPLEKYTTMVPDDPKGWSVLGRTLYQLGAKDQALDAMNKAEKLGDKSKEMYTFRARARIDKKDYEGAMADYAKGEPQPEDNVRMAQIQAIQGNTARAESLYKNMVSQDSTSSSAKFAMFELGKQRYRQKDYPGAISFLTRRIALDPNNDEAYYYLGLSYSQLKQYPEAIAALRQSVRLAPNKADRHLWLGMVSISADSASNGIPELMRAIELDSTGTSKNSGFALQQVGYYTLLSKKWNEAVGYLERSTAINDQDAQTWLWLAQGYQNSGNKAKACDAYDRALALDPNQAVALKAKKTLGCP